MLANCNLMDESTLIIGDVHGAGRLLWRLAEENPAEQIVLVGDLFDRGDEPELVWDFIVEKSPICLLGNHEYKMAQFFAGKREKGLPKAYMRALAQLNSHGVSNKRLRSFIEAMPHHLVAAPELVVVHAGIEPDAPLTPNLETNVFGCRAMRNEVKKRKDVSGAFWWDLHTSGPLVVYGHLTSRGGVRVYGQDGRPRSVGVDTGAWASGVLTGYLCDKGDPFGGGLVSVSGKTIDL